MEEVIGHWNNKKLDIGESPPLSASTFLIQRFFFFHSIIIIYSENHRLIEIRRERRCKIKE
jgi:hypothetical protein